MIGENKAMQIAFIQSEETRYYERSVYTGLDLLGDVGGLNDALYAIGQFCIFIINILTNSGPHNYVLKRLFKRGKTFKVQVSNS